MKKLISIVAAILLLSSSSYAEAPDLSTYTYNQLVTLQHNISLELASRDVVKENRITLYEPKQTYIINGGQFVLGTTGYISDQPYGGFCFLTMVFENYADPQGIAMKDVTLNDWRIDDISICTIIKPGERKRCDVLINYGNAFLRSAKEMKVLTFSVYTFDETFKTTDQGSFMIQFAPSLWE